jgi:hypothetical protein
MEDEGRWWVWCPHLRAYTGFFDTLSDAMEIAMNYSINHTFHSVEWRED